MEIRQLEYFLTVSKVNSFTRAAERLYVSQPAITNSIKSLEDELGIQLFDRTQKQITLTTEGQIFYRHVASVMQGINNTLSEIDALKNLNSGSLTIGITPLAGIHSIIHLLHNFHQQYPSIQIKFKETHSEELEQLVLNDSLDLVFIVTNASNSSLTYLSLPQEELFVCCHNHHALHRMNTVTLEQLTDESLILLASDCYFRQQLIKQFETINTMPKISFESNHIATIKHLVSANMGITILPESLCNTDTTITIIPLDPPLYIEPTVAFKTNRYPSRAAEAFIDYAKKELSI